MSPTVFAPIFTRKYGFDRRHMQQTRAFYELPMCTADVFLEVGLAFGLVA